jgi:hypothetical protein
MSLQIEKKWIGEEAVDGDKVKILYGQALKGMSVGGSEVEIIKIDASGDAVVPQGVVASESFVNSEVASEAALRIAGDASTLSSAQSYTDAEVLEEKGLREAEDLLMFKKDGSRTMTGAMNMGSFKIESLANGTVSGDAINKGQLDALESDLEGQISSLQTNLEGQLSTLETNLNGQISQLDSDLSIEETARIAADSALSLRLDSLEADEVSKTYVDSQDAILQGNIDVEKGRIDAILSASTADKDSFAEIVSLINSVDTENDSAFAGYVLSNDAAVAALQSEVDATQSGAGLGSNGSYSANTGVSYIGSASSLHDADKKLDIKLKEVSDGLAQELIDRASAITSEASARSSEDLTFVKLDGSRTMTGGLTIDNPAHVGNIEIFEQDDTVKLTYVDSANAYGGGTFNTEIYSGQIDAKHNSLGSSTLGFFQVSHTGATGRSILSNGFAQLLDGTSGTNPKMPTQNYHATPKKYVDDEVSAEESRAVAAENALDGRLDIIEAKIVEEDVMFEVGVSGVGVNYVELAHTAEKIYKVCVGRLNVFKNVDYTLSVVDGKTKITWIGELASAGASPIASGDKIFVTYIH